MEAGTLQRILVVEDEPNVALVVTFALRRAGFEVVAHTDPRAGWDWLEVQAPGSVQAIVLDLWMPALPGTAFIDRLRAHGAHGGVPVLLMTGAVPQRADLPPAGSYQRLIPKPFDLDVLVAFVGELAAETTAPELQPGAPASAREGRSDAPMRAVGPQAACDAALGEPSPRGAAAD